MNTFSKLFLAAALLIPAQQVQAFDKVPFCFSLGAFSFVIAHELNEKHVQKYPKLGYLSKLLNVVGVCSAAGFIYFIRQK